MYVFVTSIVLAGVAAAVGFICFVVAALIIALEAIVQALARLTLRKLGGDFSLASPLPVFLRQIRPTHLRTQSHESH
jgi:hypothetical protein